MLNPIANEAIYSAAYVDNYLDSVENLPDDVQRHLSRIRDIDVQYRSFLRDIDHYYDLLRTLQSAGDTTSHKRTRAMARMQQCLIQAQELSDEKMQTVYQMQELIDHKTRQLDMDQTNLDIKEDLQQQHRLEQLQQADTYSVATPQKQTRTQSPIRSEQVLSSLNGASGIFSGEHQNSNGSVGGGGKDSISNTFSGFAGSLSSCSNVAVGGGGSTPNSERSGNTSNGATCSGAANGSIGGSGGNNSNLGANDSQRVVNKRSRRRTEVAANISGNVELDAIESNSANEAGGGSSGGGNERVSLHKSANLIATQKKNSVHNQAVATAVSSVTITAVAAGSGTSTGGGASAGKKKKRKARGTQSTSQASAREETPPPDPIDPDEPTYCVCNQISFGEMILCDNDLCPIEWFHFSCVSLVLKPKGKWYCPNCRGDRPNIMKPKAQFLKELERYNKEKEEKT